jgi:hypothetical protein
MEIYLAGRFSDRFLFREIRSQLQEQGHHVTSRWIDRDDRPADHQWDETRYAYECADQDIRDILDSQVFILHTANVKEGSSNRGGLYVELGLAIAQNWTSILLCGPRTNVFTYIPKVIRVESWPEVFRWLDERRIVYA